MVQTFRVLVLQSGADAREVHLIQRPKLLQQSTTHLQTHSMCIEPFRVKEPFLEMLYTVQMYMIGEDVCISQADYEVQCSHQGQ